MTMDTGYVKNIKTVCATLQQFRNWMKCKNV